MNIIIPIAPRTKKNSQQILINPKTKRPFVMPSKLYKEYERECGDYIKYLDAPIDFPVNIKALFYMPTRRRVDLVNLQEALLDVLVKYNVLEDDCSKIVMSMDGSRVLYDKDNPRTEVWIDGVQP